MTKICSETINQTTSYARRLLKCRKILDNIGKINCNSIEQTSEETKQILRENTPGRMIELAKLNCFAATKIKNHLDETFGQNNYVLIAIGRSISSIAELMKHLGVDVKNIPMSGLRKTELSQISSEDANIYKSFLESIGISKKELKKNKDKKYILMDYAYYGRTIDKTEKFLKQENILGNADNLIQMTVNDALQEDYCTKVFSTLFSYNRFKDYSYVGQLPAKELSYVYKQATPATAPEFQGNITKGVRKLFWFNVFDSLIKNDYREIFPCKEYNALYKHYLSPKAIRIYLAREIKMLNQTTENLLGGN